MVLRPSKRHWKVVPAQSGFGWEECRENGAADRLYAREVLVPRGEHKVERAANPLVPGGEPWLVLQGSRVGAAESYLRRVAESTRGNSGAVALVME